MSEKLYKILNRDQSCNGGRYTWSLPTKNVDGTWTPGAWTKPVKGELEFCGNGYHLARECDLIFWLGRDIYEAEIANDERVEDNEGSTKIVVRSCRLIRKVETWNDRTARLFAVWCAREALMLIDRPDPRSVAAVDTAERYANGKATEKELAVAWDAARDAAWAAWDAAGAAAGAAWDAAWAARAAWDAAGAAAGAAWDAAWAARAARDAAWAARDAARDAAWAAAWAAAWDAQTKKLLELLGE